MSLLINVYSTIIEPYEIPFEHELVNFRDRTDDDLVEHLGGFADYVYKAGGEKMTAQLYSVIQHILKVQNQYSFNVDAETLDFKELEKWMYAVNGIAFMPDGSVRAPNGNFLSSQNSAEVLPESTVPYPLDAIERKDRSINYLKSQSVPVAPNLPPVISGGEVILREPQEVALRAMSLFIVALRSEFLQASDPMSLDEMYQRLPIGFEALTPAETAFLKCEDEQELINQATQFIWRYESLATLLWALGKLDNLSFPTAICNVSEVAQIMVDNQNMDFVNNAELRSTREILDALDLHYRLHWATVDARVNNVDSPANLSGSVIYERHYALNWLTYFEFAGWDEVETPT